MLDNAPCPFCLYMWYFDGPVDPGEVVHCDNCARDYRAGRWYGKHYPNALVGFFTAPVCPQCGGTNSMQGKTVSYSLPQLRVRQCRDCHAVWVARK